MAGKADMTAAAFVARYGRRTRGRQRRAPRAVLPHPVLIQLEVDGVAVTIPEFLAAHARCCECLRTRGGRGCLQRR